MAADYPERDPYADQPLPAGTVIMQVTGSTAGGFLGRWLFRDRFWGPVKGRLVVKDRSIWVSPVDAGGHIAGLGINLMKLADVP